jgi:sec-independent protein translocase protein TatB
VLGIQGVEWLVLLIVALLVLGPERLPKFAADAGRMLRDLRLMADRARADVRRELGPEFQDINLRDLDPKRFAAKHLLGPDDLDLGLDDPPAHGDGRRGRNRQRGEGRQRGGRSRPAAPRDKPQGGDMGASGPHAAEPAEPAGDSRSERLVERPPYDPDAT